MERLTITRKPATSGQLSKYEILETGETFVSTYTDIGTAFGNYMQEKDLQELFDICDGKVPQHQEPKVDDIKVPVTSRQENIEETLLRVYCNFLAVGVQKLTQDRCEGCAIFDPSQLHHDCLVLENETRVFRYFQDALDNLSNNNELETSIANALEKVPLSPLEFDHYSSNDVISEIINRKRDVLEDMVISELDS